MKKFLSLLTILSMSIAPEIIATENKDNFLLTITYPKSSNLPTTLTNKLLLNRDELLDITDKLDSIKSEDGKPFKATVIGSDEFIIGPSASEKMELDEPIKVVITDTNDNDVVYSEYINPEKNIEFYTLISTIADTYDPLYQS